MDITVTLDDSVKDVLFLAFNSVHGVEASADGVSSMIKTWIEQTLTAAFRQTATATADAQAKALIDAGAVVEKLAKVEP
jgi:hypothetical protein